MAMGKVLGGGSTAASGKSDTGDGPNLQLPRLRCGFSRQHRRQQHAVVCEPRLIADHRMAWRPSAHLVSLSTSRAAAIPLPTMTSGSLTGYPYSAPDCDHMLRKSCSRTACHKRCPTHPPLPASSHLPGRSPASTATRRRPPDSAPPSHRSRHAALPVRRRPAKPVRDCQDLSPPQAALPSACGAARSYRRDTLLTSAGRCRTDDHKTIRPRLPKSVQPWQNCPEPVRLALVSLQLSTRSNENSYVMATGSRSGLHLKVAPHLHCHLKHYPTDMMIKLRDQSFAPNALVLSFRAP